jgi:hypothetical protein
MFFIFSFTGFKMRNIFSSVRSCGLRLNILAENTDLWIQARNALTVRGFDVSVSRLLSGCRAMTVAFLRGPYAPTSIS